MPLLHALLSPPLLNVIFLALGALAWRAGRHRLGSCLALFGVISLLLLATPMVSYGLRQGLEPPPLALGTLGEAEAIVILGAGRDSGSSEFGGEDAPANASWRRLAYGAYLQRHSGLPILVSGGRRHAEPRAEAELMAEALQQVFGVPVRWQEERSRNTQENARYSAELLHEAGIQRIVLVSQAWHLPRARTAFERQGLDVTLAPTEFASPPPPGMRAWLPSAYQLRQSAQAMHEWLGRLAQCILQ